MVRGEAGAAAAPAMEPLVLVAPVTALAFVGDQLLAGEGPGVVLYSPAAEAGAGAGRRARRVLRGHTVHGLRERKEPLAGAAGPALAAFGGKGLAVLELRGRGAAAELVPRGPPCELPDWVWDARWLRGAGEQLALALAHNAVALFDWAARRTLREARCQDRGVLYSALLAGDAWHDLALVAGTVGKQLVVWRAAEPAQADGGVRPRARLAGHDGVVFSMCYAPGRGLLASAADDRSVRLWDVGDLRAPRTPARCLWVRYGHQARVWAVQLLRDGLVSAGEDCACLLWSPGGDVVRSFQGHRGRGVRAVAVHEERGWLATGGMDAGTRLWHLRGDELQQRDLGAPPGSGAPRAVRLVDPDQLLVLTDAGAVHACDVGSGRWSPVLEDGRFRSYGLLEVARLPGRAALVAMGSLGGYVRVFPLEHVAGGAERQLFAGKVHSLSWASRPGSDPGTCALFASGPEGALFWLEACCGPGGQGLVLIPRGRYLLPLCRHRWHTSAAFLPQDGLWVCGDRRGSLLLFPCGPDPARGEGESEEPPACGNTPEPTGESPAQGPVSLLFGLHGKMGVTSVTCHEGLVYSTGRDGCFRQLRVRAGQLEELRRQRPGKGLEWVEELRFTPDGDLLVLGFHADSFVLWSTCAGAPLRCLPCGGGHRSWSYHRGTATDAFSWVQAGAVHVCCGQAGSSGLQVLREALHGRQVTSVRHVGAVLGPGRPPLHVLVTGSEDTTATVLALNTEDSTATPLTTLSDHISSIRALAIAAGSLSPPVPGELSALLVSAGGRAQLECYRLLLSAAPTAPAGIACLVLHVASHRLDERWDRMRNKHRMVKMDPETRYMRIAVVVGADATELPPPCVVLAAACSDGSVRLFVLQEAARCLQLVAESFHHQRCVLQVEAFVHRPAGGARKHFLCSAATDGNIAFWDITATVAQATAAPEPTDEETQPWDLGAPVLTVPAHSCGVNSLHVLEIPCGRFLVASGSDDGSIHVCVVAVGAATTPVLLQEQLQQPSAHAASVTGLRLLQPDLLASASVDQRLVLWHLGKAGLAFLGARFCPVADVAELDCWEATGPGEQPGYCCALAGQGLEVMWCQA